MPLNINTNLASLRAQQSIRATETDLSTSVRRLASGLRVLGAKDDAAGLAIADRLDTRIRGVEVARRNVNDGVSLAQVAEQALGSIGENLQRMRELAVQAANATQSGSDRAALQGEVAQLLAEIDRVATQTRFNGSTLLDGRLAPQSFQVGADLGQRMSLPSLPGAQTSALGTWAGFDYKNVNFGGGVSGAEPIVFIAGGTTYDLGPVAFDSRAIVAALNSGAVPGLSASVNDTVLVGPTSSANASASGTGTLTLNGVAIPLAGSAGASALAANRSAAVTAINAQSAATGVVATDTGVNVSLRAADGRNIQALYAAGSFTGSTKRDFGIDTIDVPVLGTVNIRYVAPPGVSGLISFYQDNLWYSGGNVTALGTPLSRIDISSAAGASAALESIDMALGTVASSRASLGAVQNRFATAARNLETAGENLAASRSRIRDADFALETAQLTRTQVLHQAGTAMVAQANQSPQQLVQLLL